MIRLFLTSASLSLATGICMLVLGCEAGDETDPEPARESTESSRSEQSTDSEGDNVVAVVNEREITADEVERHLDRLGELYRHSDRRFDETMRANRRQQVVRRLIDRELLRDHVEQQEPDIDEERVEEVMDRRIDARFGSHESFRRYLDTRNHTVSEFENRVREELAIEEILAERAGGEAISREELRDHYERIANRRPARDRLEATRLAIRVPRTIDDDAHRALREELSEALDNIDSPAEMREIPEELGADVSTQFHLPRWFERDRFQSHSERLLFEEAPEQGPAPVVETSRGFDLYWIHERREAGIREFDEVEELLRERARHSQLERTRRQLLEDLRRQADITIEFSDIAPLDEADR